MWMFEGWGMTSRRYTRGRPMSKSIKEKQDAKIATVIKKLANDNAGDGKHVASIRAYAETYNEDGSFEAVEIRWCIAQWACWSSTNDEEAFFTFIETETVGASADMPEWQKALLDWMQSNDVEVVQIDAMSSNGREYSKEFFDGFYVTDGNRAHFTLTV